MRGHGLTLQLLGQYLRLVEDGDILKRGTVRLADADHEYQNDATRPYGHAFKAMEAYERWFQREGEPGQRQLAVLRLLGLFDRPASKGCLDALRQAPVIAGLTEPLVGLSHREWSLVTRRLEEINLLTVQPDGALDAHPLLREYFAKRMKDEGGRMEAGEPSSLILHPSSFQLAHRRLYEHLCASTKEGDQPTLEDLQPLYQAVAHGCQAGLQQEACEKIYHARIKRMNENYSSTKLGAFGSDLGAVACFFENPWSRLSPALKEVWQAWLLNEAAFRLRALGRLTEALEPMRAGIEGAVKLKDWNNAARYSSNLSELELTLGEVAGAVGDAEQSVTYADQSGDAFLREMTRTAHADSLHQAGRRAEAEARFREAEQMQAERQPAYKLLYSLSGFRYCDLLLTEAERAAWQIIVAANWRSPQTSRSDAGARAKEDGGEHQFAATPLRESCRAVSARAAQTLKWVTTQNWLLDIALDHLTLGRAALYAAILEGGASVPAKRYDIANMQMFTHFIKNGCQSFAISVSIGSIGNQWEAI